MTYPIINRPIYNNNNYKNNIYNNNNNFRNYNNFIINTNNNNNFIINTNNNNNNNNNNNYNNINSKQLPIYKVKDQIINTINNNRVTIITGNTGCGKTTQVPQIIYHFNKSRNIPVKILITQPRRIAVLNIAERLCEEMNTKKGDLVGYHYALSEVYYSENTNILIETTGIFLEELIHNGEHLDSYTHIILDEVHERDQHIDLVLLLVKLHIKRNPKVKLILMSATISSLEYSNYFSESSINELNENEFCIPRENIENIKIKKETEIKKENNNNLNWTNSPDKIDILFEADREYYEDKKDKYKPRFNEIEDIDWDNEIQQNIEYTKKINVLKKQVDSAPIITIPSYPYECYEYFADEIVRQILLDIKERNQINTDNFYHSYHNFMFQPKYNSPEVYRFMMEICYKLIEWIHKGIIKGRNSSGGGDTPDDAILIFLPGAAQIHQVKNFITNSMVKSIWDNYFLPIILHSEVDESEQKKVFEPSGNKRKIIFATNIAESSITIDNITYVIDFCLTKHLQYMYYCDREMLITKWACKASLNQRKGRAGRTRIGYVFRLIPKCFYDSLEENFSPEICRVKLDQVILRLKLYEDKNNFFQKNNDITLEPKLALQKLMDPPRMIRIVSSIISLKFNGALELGPQFVERDKIVCGDLTELGKIYAELPCSIIYSKLIMMTYAIGMLDIGIVIGSIFHVDKKIFVKTTNIKSIKSCLNFYKSLEFFSDGTNCDIIISYNAYREWFNNFGIKLIRNIKQKKLYKLTNKDKRDEEKFCERHQLNGGVLREILKNISDIKLRLIKLNVYTKNEINEENLEIPSKLRKIPNYDILKYILYGAFYKNLFIAEYENPHELNQSFFKQGENINPNEVLRFPINNDNNISEGLYKSIFINEGLFSTKSCNLCTPIKTAQGTRQLLVHYKNMQETKLILRVFKFLNLNPLGGYYYQSNYNKEKIFIEKPECSSLLKYRHYFKERQEIYLDPGSINYMNIEPRDKERQKMVFFCDSFFQNNCKLRTCFSSLLPKKPMIADFMYLIFAPCVTFISNKAKDRYIGYKVGEHNYIFKYSFSGYDICEINIIRGMLSKQIEVDRGDIQVNNYNEGVYKKIENLLNKDRFKTFDNVIWDNLIENYKPSLQIVDYMRNYHSLKKIIKTKFQPQYFEDPSIFQTEQESLLINKKINKKNKKNEIHFLPSLKVLDIMEDYRYYTDDVTSLIEIDRKMLLLLRDRYTEEIKNLTEDLSNIEPKLICSKCYDIKKEKIKLGISPLYCKNKDLCPFASLEELKSGLFLITAWPPNFDIIPFTKEKFKTKEEEIREMMGNNYENNINKIHSLLCCKKEQHIIGFTKKPNNSEIKDFYSYCCPSSPILIAFYPTKVVKPFKKEWIKAFKHYNDHLTLHTPLIKNPQYDIGKIYNDNMEIVINEFKKRTRCILCNFFATEEIKGYISDRNMILKELNQKLLDHLKSDEHQLNVHKLYNEDLLAVS